MWISEPMPVTTRIISADSGSRRSAKRHLKIARGDPGEDASADDRARSARSPTSCHDRRQPTRRTSASIASARRRRPETRLRQPPARETALIRNRRTGRSGISSSITRSLPLQRRERVRVERLAVAEQRNHDRQADRRFGRRDGHHEEHDDLPVDGRRVRGRTATNVRFTAFSMISIDSRIVIRLRRRNTPAVPIANRTPRAPGSGSSGHHVSRRSFRASTTAPTIATRISTEVASNANA